MIVGAGFFGLTIAERIASNFEIEVTIVEKRNHIGGNAYSYINSDTNIEVHKYGSHLFHTSNELVWKYVNRFSNFTNYQHQVWTSYQGKVYSLPINLHTMNTFFDKNFKPIEAKEFIQNQIFKEGNLTATNFEEKAISLIGRTLYDAFIKEYTHKQWNVDPKKLDQSIISRLPVRYDYNNRYFSDKYEGLPLNGYAELFSKMIESNKIKILLETDFFDIRKDLNPDILTIYTGPIDKYFDYSYGGLTWRTLDFQLEILDIEDYQGTSVMNFADLEIPYTRIHEFQHLHPERKKSIKRTIISKEFSRFSEVGDDPYYPINQAKDREILKRYRYALSKERNVLFGGRLGTYQYLDMHMAIASALSMYENQIRPLFKKFI